MRLSSIQWLLCAASSTVTAATAATAKVLVFDSDVSSPPRSAAAASDETVDPDTARLILAQRIELGRHHSIGSADEESIRQINAFSSPQQPLFGYEKHVEPVSRLLVIVEGVDYDTDEDIRNTCGDDFRSFSISPAPHPADNLELFKTFSAEGYSEVRTDDIDSRLSSLLAHLESFPPTGLATFDRLHAMLRFTVTNKDQLNMLNQALKGIKSMALARPSSITILFTPTSTGKRSTNPFGLSKRDSKAQRAPQEKPLISAHNKVAAAATESDVLSPPEPVSPNIASKVISGPVPTCFPSLNACERGTNNCTSHGECILKWSTDTTNDGGSVSKQDCYGCACTKPDVRKNEDGTKKTTRYGGAACHKKDIVFPFWLLAGTTVGIIGIISFGLGMLYDMGNQELPSVIGAGVSGPKGGR